jgi:mitochondrial import inner membrane translocase subunit TIM54
MVTGKRHGDLTRRIANEVRLRRRLDLGIDSVAAVTQAIPTYKPLAERRKHELDGGIVIIGRPTFKEFMAGLKKGWTDGLEEVDQEELLARELESDGHFDEPEEAEADNAETSASLKITSPLYSPLYAKPSQPPSPKTPLPFSESMNTTIPPTPPLLLVTFTDYIGFTQIPRMIWDFFNQRHKVRSGAEAGYRLVMKHSRPIDCPSGESEPLFSDITPLSQENGDLDFDKHVESFYKKSVLSVPADIEKARTKYYEALPGKLATARALARGTREPTKDEKEYPPPTEVELSAERMKNEQRWRRDLEGWDIVKPTQKVVRDNRFSHSLRIFIDPPSTTEKDIDID